MNPHKLSFADGLGIALGLIWLLGIGWVMVDRSVPAYTFLAWAEMFFRAYCMGGMSGILLVRLWKWWKGKHGLLV